MPIKVAIFSATALIALSAALYIRSGQNGRTSSVLPLRPTKEANAPLPLIRDSHPTDSALEGSAISRYHTIAQTDIRSAFATLEREASVGQVATLRQTLAQSIVDEDISKLGEVIACIPLGEPRESLLSAVIPRAVAKDFDLTLDTINQLGTLVRGSALHHVVRGLSESENFKAINAVLDVMPFSEHRTDAVEEVASALIGRDNSAFSDFLGKLLADEVPGVIRSAARTLRSRKDSVGLRALLPMISDEVERQGAIRSIILSEFERGNHDSLSPFMLELPEHDRDLARGMMLVENEEISFREGVSTALNFQQVEARNSTISGLVKRHMSEDPLQAAADVLELPSGAIDSAIATLVQTWHTVDRGQLSEWLDGLPHGTHRDKALEYYVLRIMHSDITSATRAASSITDADLRVRLLSLVTEKP